MGPPENSWGVPSGVRGIERQGPGLLGFALEEAGFQLGSGGGDRAPWLDPPPQKGLN